MPDVTSTPIRSNRVILAVSLACLALAGMANTSIHPSGQTVVATALAVLGVYGIARYAQSVSKPTLARCAICLWLAFIAVAAVHAVGLEQRAAGSIYAMNTLTAFTWSTLLGAFATTAFLAMREYGAGVVGDSRDERVIEKEYDL